MKSLALHLLFLAVTCSVGYAQKKNETEIPDKPKLVVGIVVDQMRYDFLTRYWDKYGDDGFKKLVQQGVLCRQLYYNYVPTYTGPGHASIYTGTSPAMHGIVGNHWYVKENRATTYCTQDDKTESIGTTSLAGKQSPRNLFSSTITDQLQLTNLGDSKVIGIALKDRGAILPAGNMADAAYWYDDACRCWISSSFYMKELPEWVKRFNDKKYPDQYLSGEWNTLYPIQQYTESLQDDNPYETIVKGKTSPTFPYNLKEIAQAYQTSSILRTTPFGNSLTTLFAIDAVMSENMGKGKSTDMLCVSFSSTDYVGHSFGPYSVESEDCYLRLDRDLATMITVIEKYLGKDNVLFFLTADHGVSDVPAHLKDIKIPAGYINEAALMNKAKSFCAQHFGDSLVLNYINNQFYLDDTKINALKQDRCEIQKKLALHLIGTESVAYAYTYCDMLQQSYVHFPAEYIQHGFHPLRSGDVMLCFKPNYMEFEQRGTTHGEPFSYDAHVPLIWYGWKVKSGNVIDQRYEITDIAVTLANMLQVMEPTGATGKVIKGIIKQEKSE